LLASRWAISPVRFIRRTSGLEGLGVALGAKDLRAVAALRVAQRTR
jgi:hypothetical protein